MNPELITKITELIVTVIIAVISIYVIPWLKNKVGEDKYNTILEYAETLVRSAEKIYTVEEWKIKKDYAVHLLNKKIESMGLKISESEINAIIEGAVQAVKG